MSSIANKLQAIRDMINEQVDLDSAQAFIAGDTYHAWEIMMNRPGTCKIAVGFESEDARSNFPGGDITGRTNQHYYAIISRGRSLNQTRSDNLIYGAGGGVGLYALAEKMRDKMRAMRFDPQTDEVPDYTSLNSWGKEINMTFNIDAYICRIWVGTQIALPATNLTSTNPQSLPL